MEKKCRDRKNSFLGCDHSPLKAMSEVVPARGGVTFEFLPARSMIPFAIAEGELYFAGSLAER
jgi:hypothetical protein